jgi:hypothetical protein
MLHKSLERWAVEDVMIEPLGKQGMHNFYADDVSLIIRGKPEYLQSIMQTFEVFGKTSGLYVSWPKTKAAHISDGPLPIYLDNLHCSWE